MTIDREGPRTGPARARPAWELAPAVVDGALFVGVSVLAVTMFATGGESGARVPDVIGGALLVVSAAPLLVRRRWAPPAFLAQR